MDEVLVPLVFAFIALGILSVMIDMAVIFLESIMEKIPFLPDSFHKSVSYLIVILIGGFICWQLDFGLFVYLGLTSKWPAVNWILTALIISGGSSLVRKSYNIVNDIPTIATGIKSTITRIAIPNKRSTPNKDEDQKDDYEGRV